MNRTTQFSAIAAACLLATACATHQTSRADSASTLALGGASSNTAAGSHGMTTTMKDRVNEDLLAFIRGNTAA